jgi:hypothetical protein
VLLLTSGKSVVTRSQRRLTAMWSLLVLFSAWGTEAAGLHPCPHHDRIVEAAPATAPSAHGHGAHHAPAAPEHTDHGCTCASGCPAMGLALVAPPAERIAVRVAASPSPAPRAADAGPTLRDLPFFLPYGMAPPAV